jgi:hypothetical protein
LTEDAACDEPFALDAVGADCANANAGAKNKLKKIITFIFKSLNPFEYANLNVRVSAARIVCRQLKFIDNTKS